MTLFLGSWKWYWKHNCQQIFCNCDLIPGRKWYICSRWYLKHNCQQIFLQQGPYSWSLLNYLQVLFKTQLSTDFFCNCDLILGRKWDICPKRVDKVCQGRKGQEIHDNASRNLNKIMSRNLNKIMSRNLNKIMLRNLNKIMTRNPHRYITFYNNNTFVCNITRSSFCVGT